MTATAPYDVYWNTTAGSNSTVTDWTTDTYVLRGVQSNVQPSPPPAVPAPREFNKYVNASDLLEEFVAFLGENGVRRGEVLRLPLDLWFKWLIVRACEEEDEKPPVVVQIPTAATGRKRCQVCQRFMKDSVAVPLHRKCAPAYYARLEAA